ncbi:phosphoribosyl-AMP cyclohydrolase [Candidatus Gottesmanbacteria bacterium]|nr:phosphoribosyl-AMP cyclohydrolase [Candidatus Gottesmanbacteria bacterium]
MKLIPTIIQEEKSGEVLMLGYMNDKSLKLTKGTGYVYFWSRKRKKLWKKGESSGNTLKVKSLSSDCDNDTLLIKVDSQDKNICHKGTRSCFNYEIK